MEAKMSVLFYLRKSKSTKDNLVPIYMRVTIDGKRFEATTDRFIEPARWSSKAGKIKGTSEEFRCINTHLDIFKRKAFEYQQEILLKNLPLSVETFKSKWWNLCEYHYTLLQVFQQHNDDLKKLIGKGYAKATWTKYETTRKHLFEFIRWKYKLSDIGLKALKYEFVTSFEFYLKSQKTLGINSCGKCIKNLKKVVTQCVAKDWIDKDPFMRYQIKHWETKISFLSGYELKLLTEKVFSNERLSIVKDLFLFSCYTSYAYVDAVNLTLDNILIGIDGRKWIAKDRQKTEISSRVPVLPPVQEIIEKYQGHPKTSHTGRLLPMLSNQKVNAYLKEIADLTGIKKELTFHMARHTFATTVTLSNGVPIETVSKMMGHKSIKTTQIYAKVIDAKVSADMEILFSIFSLKSNPKQLNAL